MRAGWRGSRPAAPRRSRSRIRGRCRALGFGARPWPRTRAGRLRSRRIRAICQPKWGCGFSAAPSPMPAMKAGRTRQARSALRRRSAGARPGCGGRWPEQLVRFAAIGLRSSGRRHGGAGRPAAGNRGFTKCLRRIPVLLGFRRFPWQARGMTPTLPGCGT